MSNKQKPEEPGEEALRMFYIRNWDQVNYLRSIIMWFTDVYIAVIVGAVVLLGSKDFKNQSFLLIFFCIVAVVGFLITWRMDGRIKDRLEIGKDVMRELNLHRYILKPAGPITWRRCLTGFYSVMFILWLYLLISLLIN